MPPEMKMLNYPNILTSPRCKNKVQNKFFSAQKLKKILKHLARIFCERRYLTFVYFFLPLNHFCMRHWRCQKTLAFWSESPPPPTPTPQWGQTTNVVQWIFRGLNILQLFLGNKLDLVIEWTLNWHLLVWTKIVILCTHSVLKFWWLYRIYYQVVSHYNSYFTKEINKRFIHSFIHWFIHSFIYASHKGKFTLWYFIKKSFAQPHHNDFSSVWLFLLTVDW